MKFQSWSLKNETFSPYFEKLFADFEKETGVKVEWLDQPGDGYQEKVLSQANSNTLPDVINLPPDIAYPLADAGVLLGVPLAEEQVVGHAVIHFPNSLPPQTPAHRVRVADLTERLAGTPGLAITGAWFAGTGLAAVIPHAERVAEELA